MGTVAAGADGEYLRRVSFTNDRQQFQQAVTFELWDFGASTHLDSHASRPSAELTQSSAAFTALCAVKATFAASPPGGGSTSSSRTASWAAKSQERRAFERRTGQRIPVTSSSHSTPLLL